MIDRTDEEILAPFTELNPVHKHGLRCVEIQDLKLNLLYTEGEYLYNYFFTVYSLKNV